MPVFQSGAFFQQCFSVHPLSLCLKLVGLPETLGIFCVNCRMRHRMMVNPPPGSGNDESGSGTGGLGLEALHACFQAHADEIRITSVDIERQAVQLRCRPCHRIFNLDIRLFETHQA